MENCSWLPRPEVPGKSERPDQRVACVPLLCPNPDCQGPSDKDQILWLLSRYLEQFLLHVFGSFAPMILVGLVFLHAYSKIHPNLKYVLISFDYQIDHLSAVLSAWLERA